MNTFIRISVVLFLVLNLTGCGPKTEETTTETERIEKVKIQTLEKTTIARHVNLSTTLEGYEVVNIAPSLTGRIENIYVEVGDKVNKGDLLVRMDQNQLNTAKLTFANLGLELQRMETLRKTETVSEQAYDQIKLSYDQTKESIEFLTQNTFVKAPIKGVISARNNENGELFAGAQPILVLSQVHQLKALINIPETYFPMVKNGMKLELDSDIYPDQKFPAVIEVVYPTVDQNTHTFQAKLKIDNSKNLLLPGMFVRTILDLDKIESMVVPYQAVLKLVGSNNRYVFIDEGGVAKRVDITLGQRYDEMVEIISKDLKEGDKLVVLGQAKLIDGVKLDVVK